MGFFSKVRKRIKKIIPKEIRPFVPYLAAMIPGAQGLAALNPHMNLAAQKALFAGGTRFLTDDEADLKDVGITSALAAAPQMLGDFAGPTGPDTNNIMGMLRGGARTLADQGPIKTLAAQGAIDAGIKAAELNEDALERYNRELLEQGIADKAGRRSAIRAIYEGTGTWDMDEVDEMLDTYGYKTGGRVRHAVGDMVTADSEEVISEVPPAQLNQIEGSQAAERAYQQIFEKFMERFPGLATGEETLEEMIAMLQAENVMGTPGVGILGADAAMEMITPESAGASAQALSRHRLSEGGRPWEKRSSYKFDKKKKKKGKKWDSKKERWVDSDAGDDFFDSLDAAKEGYDTLEELNTIKPLPIRELRLASGGDVNDEVMEFDEEIITPDYLMKEEGVEIGEQVSDPSRMDELNSLSMDLFGKPLGELSEIQMEMLMNFASQQASGYSQEELDMYENYKYDMNEQRPGMPIMSIDEYLQMELGAARAGVKKGGPIKKPKVKSIGIGKAKDYPGIKKILEMNKKGRKKFAEGGLMNLGGNEMDLRGGGFVPLGAKERADDVPARLSKNEFVMTADAVRGAGGGSVQKGADLMYDQMKRLEGQA